MKRLLMSILMLSALIAACIAPNPMDVQAADSDFMFGSNGDGTYCVMRYVSTGGSVTIPSAIGGYPVTTIRASAFSDRTTVTSVTIPDSITSIGNHAFSNCTGLSSITIPNSVTIIGNNAFENCTTLTRVTLPDSITSIGDQTFHNCSNLTSVTIPDSVTDIGNYAFYKCTSLSNITIPNSVTNISSSAFIGCNRLTGIWVDTNNPNYSSDSYGILFNKDKSTLLAAPGAIQSYTIPDSVTNIGYGAFHDCTSLTRVTLPDSVTDIDDYAFYHCFRLTSVTIPNSVTCIGDYAFHKCTGLSNVYYVGTQEQWDAITIGGNNTALTDATLNLVSYCTAYGHTEEIIPGKDPTDTEPGLTEGKKCSVCGEILLPQTIIRAKQRESSTLLIVGIISGTVCLAGGIGVWVFLRRKKTV